MDTHPNTPQGLKTPPPPGVEHFKVEILIPRAPQKIFEQALLDAGASIVTTSEVGSRWASAPQGGGFHHRMDSAASPARRRRCLMHKVEVVTSREQLAQVHQVIDAHIAALPAARCEVRVVPLLDYSIFTASARPGPSALEAKHAVVFECVFDMDSLL